MKLIVKRKILTTATALLGTFAFSTAAMAINRGGGNNDPSQTYANAGSFGTTSQGIGSCTVFRPTSGSGHPVIIWGNGTGASPSTYSSGLTHWASHGFVVSAANTSNAGTGTEMLACINAAAGVAGVDATRIGASGHSQGGGGTIMAGRDSRIDATAPMQPYILGLGYQPGAETQQHSPMLLLSGSNDSIATESQNQQVVFDNANVAVFWASRNGANHFEATGDFGNFSGISTAWFRYLLMNDQAARDLFTGPCSMCGASGWTIRTKGTLP